MNKKRNVFPAIILMILSVVILFIVNNNYGNLNHKAGPSQVESTTLSDNSDSENNIYTKIDWLNDYTMPCDITGDSVLGFEDDKLIFLSFVRVHGQPKYAPESTKLSTLKFPISITIKKYQRTSDMI